MLQTFLCGAQPRQLNEGITAIKSHKLVKYFKIQ